MQLSLSDVNMKNWRELEKLAPFGLGNEKPVFFFKGVKIEKLKNIPIIDNLKASKVFIFKFCELVHIIKCSIPII